jgi:hypothetical protein
MALRDPVAVYNAANNLEAIFVRDALTAAGVEAYVTEDVSQVGVWAFGFIPEIHKPQVWVDRADVERAKPLLDGYEQRAAELRRGGGEGEADGSPVEAVCEECGQRTSFPAAQRGSVQQCPQCGAYLDVGEEELPFDEEEGEAEAD